MGSLLQALRSLWYKWCSSGLGTAEEKTKAGHCRSMLAPAVDTPTGPKMGYGCGWAPVVQPAGFLRISLGPPICLPSFLCPLLPAHPSFHKRHSTCTHPVGQVCPVESLPGYLPSRCLQG